MPTQARSHLVQALLAPVKAALYAAVQPVGQPIERTGPETRYYNKTGPWRITDKGRATLAAGVKVEGGNDAR